MNTKMFRTLALIGVLAGFTAACSDDATLVPDREQVAGPSLTIINGTDLLPDMIRGAKWTPAYDVPTSVGTGVIRPFLDFQDSPTEQGFNTDNDDFQYDQHRTSDTNHLSVNWVPRIFEPGFGFGREFVLDAHESDSDLIIQEFDVWLCNTTAAETYSLRSQYVGNALCREIYDIVSDTINGTDQYSSGSGNVFDYQILIPDSAYQRAATQLGITLCPYNPSDAAVCTQYLLVWAKLSDTGSTFEEFSTILRPPPPDLTIVKTPDGQTVDAGNPISFTITVSNAVGASDATNVVVTDTLPGGVGISWSTTSTGCSISAGPPQVLTCNFGTIAAGASKSAVVTSNTTGGSCGVYNNTARFTADMVDPESDTGQITVANCTGTVTIVKLTVGGNGTFAFTGTGGAPIPASSNLTTVANKDSVVYANVPVGSYTVAETGLPGGWAFTSLSCTGNGTGGNTSGQTANIVVELDATVRCVFTNTKQAGLVIVKETLPDGDATAFTFTPYGYNSGATFTRTDNQAGFASGPLAPGGYTVEETKIAGYALTSRTCVLTDGPGSVSYTTPNTDSVAVTLAAGQTVTCTFQNTKQAELRVVKSTLPDADPTAFTFTPYGWNGGATFTRTDNQAAFSSGFLTPGQSYTVEETQIAGYALTARTCVLTSGPGSVSYTTPNSDSVTVALAIGQVVTCTFENTKQAKLRVIKETSPDGNTTDFTFTPYGWNGGSTFTRRDNQAAFESAFLTPGQTYRVEETVPAGWSLTNRACVLTEGPGPLSYTTPNSDSIAVALGVGQVVTCTFTNTQAGELRIVKETIPDGNATDFTFTPYGWNSGATFTRRDNQAAFSSGYLPPGSYAVEETLPAGFALTARSCVLTSGPGSVTYTTPNSDSVAVTLAAGQVVTCTFQNTQQSELRIVKETLPDGDATAFTFTPYGWNGGSTFTRTDNQAAFSSGSLVPGNTYRVEETVPAGYALTARTCVLTSGPGSVSYTTPNSDSVAVTLAAGQVVTCTFQNTKLSKLLVAKVTLPDGDATDFTFTPYGWNGGSTFTRRDNQAAFESAYLAAGAYVVEETKITGYTLTSRACVLTSGTGSWTATFPNTDSISVTLGIGQVVTCTFTNVKQARLRIVKQTIPDADPQLFTFTPRAWNGGASFQLSDGQTKVSEYLDPGTYAVGEVVPIDWFLKTGTAGRNCVNTSGGGAHAFTTPGDSVSVALAAGEDVTCTFTNEELGTLIVQKEIPGTNAQTFEFTRSLMPAGVPGSFVLGDGQNSSTGRTLRAGNYNVCEIVPAGWADPTATINGAAAPAPAYDMVATFCWNGIAVAAGDTTYVVVTNTPPPGTTRTIGYWKNWSSCTGGKQWEKALAMDNYDKTLDGNLPQTLGLLTLLGDDGDAGLQATDCMKAVNILSKNAIDGTKRPGDPIYNMAAQYLGALLNMSAGSGSCTAADDAMDDAADLLSDIGFTGLHFYAGKSVNYTLTTDQINLAMSTAGILDSFNNGTLGAGCPTHAQ